MFTANANEQKLQETTQKQHYLQTTVTQPPTKCMMHIEVVLSLTVIQHRTDVTPSVSVCA